MSPVYVEVQEKRVLRVMSWGASTNSFKWEAWYALPRTGQQSEGDFQVANTKLQHDKSESVLLERMFPGWFRRASRQEFGTFGCR